MLRVTLAIAELYEKSVAVDATTATRFKNEVLHSNFDKLGNISPNFVSITLPHLGAPGAFYLRSRDMYSRAVYSRGVEMRYDKMQEISDNSTSRQRIIDCFADKSRNARMDLTSSRVRSRSGGYIRFILL